MTTGLVIVIDSPDHIPVTSCLFQDVILTIPQHWVNQLVNGSHNLAQLKQPGYEKYFTLILNVLLGF